MRAVGYALSFETPTALRREGCASMALEVVDVVVLLPGELRESARELSDRLAARMSAHGGRSHFRLGDPFATGPSGTCEPHVSLFMLAADQHDIADVVAATRRAATTIPALAAEGEEYRHNPFGAPELYFRRTAEWIELQRAVISAMEPLRRGRLRETDPSGARIQELMADPRTDPARRSQLARFGYDEVTEEWNPAGGGPHDRFNPHVTLAWPVDPESKVELANLPPADDFSGLLTELAVYGMSPYGTCTRLYGTAPLDGARAKSVAPGSPRGSRAVPAESK
jgi:hypothetical protein